MSRNRYNSNLSFIDMLLNTSFIFGLLFILSFALVAVAKKKQDIEAKAEAMIILEWDKDSTHDVDIWVKDPNGSIVSYLHRQAGLMFLDTDDTGLGSTKTMLSTGETKVVHMNREMVTIRGFIAGTYSVNVIFFNRRPNMPDPHGTVQFLMLNPYREVFTQPFDLHEEDEELTIAQITMSAEGRLMDINHDQDHFVDRKKTR